MNKRIKELEPQCWEMTEFGLRFDYEKFAELIVQEHLYIMKTEWYELNNMPVDREGESPRDVGMRVGRKTEVIALMSKVSKHFGVE
jgi:hypothetical protein